ncbi:MAG: helix-turn-helix domain-containing protein [Caldilineaceae bacterium]
MNRKEFGKLIAALREEHIEFSARGMGVWTQSKLAKEANLAEKTIAQLEQGKKMNLDPQTLTQLARALKLTAGEQVELYTAAAEVDSAPHKTIRDRSEETLRTLTRLLGDVRVPAYLHDPYANVIAGNTVVTELLCVPETMLQNAPSFASGFNLMRFVFSPQSPFRSMLGEHWFARATSVVLFFRMASLKYRYTPRFKAILAEVSEYPSFRDIWFNTQIYAEELTFEWSSYEYHHPAYGAVSFVSHVSATLTSEGALYLVTFLPRTRHTSEAVESIINRKGIGVQKFIAWPYEAE